MSRLGFAVGTASGNAFWPADPQAKDFRIEDMAAQLSRICRFGGALKNDIPGIYSVAQHCVLASQLAPAHLALEALLHDAHEAYIGDMVTPLKRMLPDYADIEAVCESAMRAAFNLPAKLSPEVKDIDRRLLATEKRDLCPPERAGLDWGPLPEPYDFKIMPVLPVVARRAFLARFEELLPNAF